MGSLSREGVVYQDINEPTALALLPPAPFACGRKAAHYHHVNGALAIPVSQGTLLATTKGMLGAVALPSPTERLGASLLAPNGAGDDSRDVVLEQIAVDQDAGEAAVEVEAGHRDT